MTLYGMLPLALTCPRMERRWHTAGGVRMTQPDPDKLRLAWVERSYSFMHDEPEDYVYSVKGGRVLVQIKQGGVIPPDEARHLAYALLAAAEHAEKEDRA